jgi:hypothetical protein
MSAKLAALVIHGMGSLCHMEYWTDKDFTKPVAEFLGVFL